MHLEDASQVAPFDELGTIEVKALDVEPASRGEPDQAAMGVLLDVRLEVIAPRVKKSKIVGRFRRRCIVAFETVARGTGVDEVLDVVRPPRRARVEMIDLELTTDR